MATDVEKLIVSLEASTAKYERALNKANGITEQRVKSMQSKFDGLGGGVSRVENRITGSLGSIGRAFGVLGIALTATSIIAMTSAWTDLNSRISNAAGGIEKGAAVMDQLSVMARRTYSSLNQTAEGYLQNSQALAALGYSTQQQLDLVEALNNSLVISATRGQAAQSVMDAWSKAMAGGTLRGENLNTIIQKGGRLSKALADSMGVSVNELRKMGEQGKITTDVMYGVTSQLEALRNEAELMPATVSDGFVLLNNAVLKFVGEADKAVGSSNSLAEAIIAISDAIDRAPDEPWFDRVFGELGDEAAKTLNTTYKELVAIGRALDYISSTSPGGALDDFVKFGEGDSTKGIENFELAVADAEQAVSNLLTNTKGRFGEVDAAVQDLFQQVLAGQGTAVKAEEALVALAGVNPEFAALKDGISEVIARLFALRDAAVAANQAAANTTTDLGAFPSRRVFNKQFGPDLSADGAPGGPIKPSGSGSTKKTPEQKFDEDLTQYARKIEMLKQETALTAALNPLLNDHGLAKTRLKTIQELENSATKAGLALTPERVAQIAALAEGYAQATVEAAKLAEAQAATVEQMDNLRDAARDAMQTMIDGFLEGKDAGEIFANVLGDIGKQLISMGMGGLFGKGSGDYGAIGKMFGFADGGYTGAGGKHQPAGVVHKGEVVWSQRDVAKAGGVGVVEAMRRGMGGYADGGVVAMPRLPSIPAAQAGGGTVVNFAPAITMTDGSPESIARLEKAVGKMQGEFEGRVKKIVSRRGKDMW